MVAEVKDLIVDVGGESGDGGGVREGMWSWKGIWKGLLRCFCFVPTLLEFLWGWLVRLCDRR